MILHRSSYEKMKNFVSSYLKKDSALMILDVGAQDVNGTYRPLFNHEGWQYFGCDTAPGTNVDIVLKDPYNWSDIATASFDVVISGQAFEHIEYFWLTMLEIARALKEGGMCCLIAPSGGPEHRYPVDCWRFFPDGWRALARYSQLEVVETYVDTSADTWLDSILIARKPPGNAVIEATQASRRCRL